MSGNHQLILVTGPTRSGKSEWAEQLAIESGKPVTYIATAQANPDDAEWQARIKQHQLRRPLAWTTLEAPVKLAETIQSASATCLLIDSLGTWVTNFLEQDEPSWNETVQHLISSLVQVDSCVIMVAEEVGWGVVPAYPLGRQFRDRLGSLTRQIGLIAHPVYLVTAGYVLNLSQLGTPLRQTPDVSQ